MLTLKTAFNRGHSRVWLDRASCAKLAIHHGAPFVAVFSADRIALRFDPARFGDLRPRRVAGSPDRPVIDVAGSKVSAVLPKGGQYTASRHGSTVTIRPA